MNRPALRRTALVCEIIGYLALVRTLIEPLLRTVEQHELRALQTGAVIAAAACLVISLAKTFMAPSWISIAVAALCVGALVTVKLML